MRVVLDSTALCADFGFSGSALRILADSAARTGLTVLIPEVVRVEVQNRHLVAVRESADAATQAAKKWSRLTGKDVEAPSWDAARASKDYAAHLRKWIKQIGGGVAPLPQTPHGVLLAKSVARHRPFRENGAGYRDALIWETVIELLKAKPEPLAFVTNNSEDFGRAPALHGHLADDLASAGFEAPMVRLFATIEAFNNEIVIPRLERVESVLTAFSEGSSPIFDVREWAEWNLLDMVREQDCDEHIVGLEHGDVWAHDLHVDSVAIDDVRLLPSGDMAVFFSVVSTMKIDVSASIDDFEHADVREFFGPLDEFTSRFAHVDVKATLYLSAVVAADSHELRSIDVDGVDSNFASWEYRAHPTRANR